VINIADSLSEVTKLGFDTAPVIYFVEEHPRYDALVTTVFERVEAGQLAGVTSTITLVEGLVLPIRQNDLPLAQKYRDLLLGSEHFEVMSIDAPASEIAARLRAEYALRTPDAL